MKGRPNGKDKNEKDKNQCSKHEDLDSSQSEAGAVCSEKEELVQKKDSVATQKEKQENQEDSIVDIEKGIKSDELSEEALKSKDKELEEYRERLLRLHAEFDNFKKRMAKEKQEFMKYANESLILELIYIFDNFELAFNSATKSRDFDALHKGVEMILNQMRGFLKEKGLERIESVGKKFDPTRHDAIEQIEMEGCEDNIVIEEFQPGYMLYGRIIRPAKVKVSKRKSVRSDKECDSKPADNSTA